MLILAGMIHAGIGEAQLSTWLLSINLPTIGHRSLKKREREAGNIIVQVADSSCRKSVASEITQR